MFDQQLDVFGGSKDLAPKHEQPRMFEFPKTTPGQLPIERPPRYQPCWTIEELQWMADHFRGGSLARACLDEIAWREGRETP